MEVFLDYISSGLVEPEEADQLVRRRYYGQTESVEGRHRDAKLYRQTFDYLWKISFETIQDRHDYKFSLIDHAIYYSENETTMREFARLKEIFAKTSPGADSHPGRGNVRTPEILFAISLINKTPTESQRLIDNFVTIKKSISEARGYRAFTEAARIAGKYADDMAKFEVFKRLLINDKLDIPAAEAKADVAIVACKGVFL